MIIEQIALHNFRQYNGSQKLHFSKDTTRNITVIHGENGTGKTALLNAFIWCLYGKIDLPNPNEIINESAASQLTPGEEIKGLVRIQFTNEGRSYTVTRSINAKKNDQGNLDYQRPQLEVQYIDIDGSTITPKGAQNLIDQIIPPDMRNYFFFDGERIDKMQDKDKAKDIKNAIKVVMGLEILERSVNHLDGVGKRFREESAKLGSSEQQKILADLNELTGKIESKETEKSIQEANKVSIEEDIKDVQSKLRSLEESRDLQQQRETLEKESEAISDQLKDHHKKMRSFISKMGYLAFAADAMEKASTYLDSKREKNEIPTGIKQQFVDDLLERHECICGRSLEEETQPYERLVEWRSKASTKQLEDAFLKTSADLKFSDRERSRMFDDLVDYRKRKDDLVKARLDIQGELSEIQAKLEGKDVEEIANLAKKERELKDQLYETRLTIDSLEREIQDLKKQEKTKKDEFDNVKAENEKAQLAKKRLDTCEVLKSTFSEILGLRAEEVQIKLQEKISDVYGRLLRKGYEIKLTDNYEIEVYKVIGSDRKLVGMSQGERQITSLSFIGALVDMAREQYESQKSSESMSTLRFGGYYPIIMDSPFGQLDEDHQSRVAQKLPTLAHQIIVVVSSSQWRGVQNFMKDLVGREYELLFHQGSEEYTEIKELNVSAKTTA